MTIPEDLRQELIRLYTLRNKFEADLEQAIRVAQFALGIPVTHRINLDTGEITAPDDENSEAEK